MPAPVHIHRLSNGLTLLAERMDHVRSAAFTILVPAGCAYDPPGRPGLANIVSQLVTRGAGDRDSEALTLALDNLGLDRDETAAVMHVRFAGATLAANLPAALDIYADIVRRPHFPDDELEPVQALAAQELAALEDEPRQKVLLELRRMHYPAPLSNDRRGTLAGIEATTNDDVRDYFGQRFGPAGTIIAVAGNIEWEPLVAQIERLFGDWTGAGDQPLSFRPGGPQRDHLSKETEQTQIGIAYDTVPIGTPDYYAALGAVQVLSGGMSSRLFTHVREERGLCYAVWATYQSFKDRAAVLCYAGTTNARAQETLDVTLNELKRLKDGITADEVQRVQAGLKSSLIMAEESTTSRAGSLASDWYNLGRVRPTEEVQAAIDALSPQLILDHLARHPAQNFTIVTLGPTALTT